MYFVTLVSMIALSQDRFIRKLFWFTEEGSHCEKIICYLFCFITIDSKDILLMLRRLIDL